MECKWLRQRGFAPAADPSNALRCGGVSTKFSTEFRARSCLAGSRAWPGVPRARPT